MCGELELRRWYICERLEVREILQYILGFEIHRILQLFCGLKISRQVYVLNRESQTDTFSNHLLAFSDRL